MLPSSVSVPPLNTIPSPSDSHWFVIALRTTRTTEPCPVSRTSISAIRLSLLPARHMCTRRHARHSHPQHLRVKSAAYPLAGTTHVNVIVPAPPVMRLKRTRYQLRQHRWCVLITTHQPCQTCHLCTRRPTTTPFHTPPAPAHQVRSPPTRRPTHNDAIYMRDAQFSSVQ